MGQSLTNNELNDIANFKDVDQKKLQKSLYYIQPDSSNLSKIKSGGEVPNFEDLLMPIQNTYENFLNFENLIIFNLSYDILICDVKQKKIVRTLKGHRNTIFKMFANKEGVLYSLSYDFTIRKWDIDLGICLKCLFIPCNTFPVDFTVNEQDHILTLHMDSGIYVFTEWKSKIGVTILQGTPEDTQCFSIENDFYIVKNINSSRKIYLYNSTMDKPTLFYETENGCTQFILLQDETFLYSYSPNNSDYYIKRLNRFKDTIDVYEGGLVNHTLLPIDHGYLKLYKKYTNLLTEKQDQIDHSGQLLEDYYFIQEEKSCFKISMFPSLKLIGIFYLERSYGDTTKFLKFPLKCKGKKAPIYEKMLNRRKMIDINFKFN